MNAFINRLSVTVPVLLTSCATIISGTSQAVTIDSNVKGAEVRIEGNLVGVTPFSGKIKRQREAVVLVTSESGASQSITMTSTFNPVTVLSIFWDYSTTDCLTGACWEYAPNTYFVNINEEGMTDAAFRRESSLLAFAMTYFGELKQEAAAGDGPTLRSLHAEYFADQPLGDFVSLLKSRDAQDPVAFGMHLSRHLSI